MKIKNTKDVENIYIKALVYAPSGHGKTSLAKTLNPKDTLVISAESGLLPLRQGGVDYIDLSRSEKDELLEAPEQRIARLQEIYHWLNTSQTKYRTLFIDSLSEISQLMVAALNKQFPDRKDSLVLWGENAKRMRAIVKAFRDLPRYHIVITCLSSVEKDDVGKRFTTFNITGKVSDELPGFFDEVFYLAVSPEGKRQLITQPQPAMLCKDRSGRLNAVEEADLGLIWAKILAPEQKEKEKC